MSLGGPDNEALLLFRRLMVHAQSLTGSRVVASEIVHQCLQRYPRTVVLKDMGAHDSLLGELTVLARDTVVIATDACDSSLASEFQELPFAARACISLHMNFDMDFARISRVMGIGEDEAREFHDQSLSALSKQKP